MKITDLLKHRGIRRIDIIVLTCLLTVGSAMAQTPDWVKKASKSVFTLKTFASDGTLKGSCTGFFISDDGQAVSCFTPFKGAARAIVIDAQGKELAVSCMLGADELYDAAKFRVDMKKSQPLDIADKANVDETVWIVPYRELKRCPQTTILKVEPLKDDYQYYTMTATPDWQLGSPLMTSEGKVVGIMQPQSTQNSDHIYAVSASFAASLKINGLSLNDAALRSTDIPKDLPDELDQANLMLYLASSSSMDSVSFARLVEDFIRKFPNAADGYTYRAQIAVDANNFAAASRDMETAINKADNKDEAHYSYARMIYQKELYHTQPYEPWSMEKAFSEAEEACRTNDQPVYRQLQAQIRYSQQRYAEAAQLYSQLIGGELRSAQLFYEASRCQEMLRDTTAQLALLDSAIATFSRPYLREAAPFIFVRAQARLNAGRYRDAVSDLNDYETTMPSGLTDRFYYLRHQAEVGGRLFQQALNDIDRAITLNPDYELYYAEKASLQVRVGLYDDALATAKECVFRAPDYSDGYLFLGLAQCLKGQKAEGVANLKRAKELGDPQADDLIEKYSK